MTKQDQEGPSADGIVSEDMTQLMEHIELTGERRLATGPEWETVSPADDLEDAPIFVNEEIKLLSLYPESLEAEQDLELFTETEIDLTRRISQVEDEQLKLAAGIGAERARWQKRVMSLRADMSQRNRLLGEREQEIEDLSAQLATMAVERDGFLEELRELQRSVGRDEVLEVQHAPTPSEGVIAALHERLRERSQTLLDAREEIDRLRVEREQLMADIADREELVQNLHQALLELELGGQGGTELRQLVRRFFSEPKAEVVFELEPPSDTSLEAIPDFDVDAPAEARAETSPSASYTMEVPIVDMADFEDPLIEDLTPPVAAEPEIRVRRYLIGLDQPGSVFEVRLPRINIGRTRDNDFRIVDPTVSRLHAVLKVRGSEATVIDANSRNGVFVNGIQLRYAKLEDGDTLGFGAVQFRYRVGSNSPGGEYGPA